MKHFLFLLAVTMLGGTMAIAVPFWGVLLYYGFATLRPQYLWEWSLSQAPSLRWSLTVGLLTIVATLINLPAVLRDFRGNKVLVLLFIYATLMLLSMLTAFNPSIAEYWAQEYGKFFLMAFIASLVIQRFWQVRAMAVMIVACLGYIAYEVNFLYVTQGGRLDIFHHGYGGLDNNGAGALLVLGLPFAYFLAVSPVGAWSTGRRIIGLLLGLGILHAVMMTYSRGAMLTAGIGLVWLVLHHRPRGQAVVLAVCLVGAISVMAGQEIRDRMVSTTNYQTDASAQSRFDSWAAAWDMAWDHPILGNGIRNSNEYSQNSGADIAGRTIHNQYLQIAADSGVPAAGVYSGMILIGLVGLGRAKRRCRDAERAFEDGPEPDGPHTRDELVARARDAGGLCLGLQTALLMFSVSGLFLSVELVEVPWLLIVLAGVLPAAVDRRLEGLGAGRDGDDEDDGDAEPAPRPEYVTRNRNRLPERAVA